MLSTLGGWCVGARTCLPHDFHHPDKPWKLLELMTNLVNCAVRFRNECASAVNGQYWSEGGLPAALDLVLSTVERPAVALLDTW